MPDPTVPNTQSPSAESDRPTTNAQDGLAPMRTPNRPALLQPLPAIPEHTEDTSPTCIPSAFDLAELDDDAPTSEDENFFGAVAAVRRELATTKDVSELPGAPEPVRSPVPDTYIDDLDDPLLDVGPVFLAAALLTAGLIGITWFLITLL